MTDLFIVYYCEFLLVFSPDETLEQDPNAWIFVNKIVTVNNLCF